MVRGYAHCYPPWTGTVGALFNAPGKLLNFNFLNTDMNIFYLTVRLIRSFNLLLFWIRQKMCHVGPPLWDISELEKISILQSELDPSDLAIFFFFTSCPCCLASGLCLVYFQYQGSTYNPTYMMTCTFYFQWHHIYVKIPIL